MADGINNDGFHTFGYYQIKEAKNLKEDIKGAFKGHLSEQAITLANILGWIPIIGQIIGAIRIYAASQLLTGNPSDEDKNKAAGLLARGVAEILFCGILATIVDGIITIALISQPEGENHEK